VTRELDEIIARRGRPLSIRCDNGPQLTSRSFLAWVLEWKIDLRHIQPGKPIQNAHVESFHGGLREECLRVSWLRNLFDARIKIAGWRKEYNERHTPASATEHRPGLHKQPRIVAKTQTSSAWKHLRRFPLCDNFCYGINA
jgi:putative transposase